MARGDNVIQRIIRLIFDKAAAARAQSQAEGSVTVMDRAFGKLKTAALKVGAAIVAAFAVERLLAFASAAVRAAQESDRAWTKTSIVLRNAGVAIGDYREQIELAANALQASTKFTDEEAVDAIGRMVAIHGDAAKALRDLKFAADLAVASDRDLASAAEAVGRARAGNTRLLKEFGIAVKDGAEGVEELERRLKGISDLDDPFAKFAKSSGELLESVGKLIFNSPLVRNAIIFWTQEIDKLTGSINKLQAAVPKAIDQLSVAELVFSIEEAERRVAVLAATGITGAVFDEAFARMTALNDQLEKLQAGAKAQREKEAREERERQAELAKERDAAQAKDIAALSTLLDLGRLTTADRERALIIERNIADQLERGVRSAERRAELETRLANIRRVTFDPGAPPAVTPELAKGLTKISGPHLTPGAVIARAPSEGIITREMQALQDLQDKYDELAREATLDIGSISFKMFELEDAAFAAAFTMESAFQDAFSQLFSDFEDLGEFAANIFGGIAQGGLAAIAQLARGKMAEHTAEAIGQLARGIGLSLVNPPLAAAHFASAAKHGAAVAAWALLAGAAGAGIGALQGGGGGGSAGAGGSSRATTNTFQGDQKPAEVHIHFMGSTWTALSRASDFQYAVNVANELGKEKVGTNVRTFIHTGGR